MKIVVSLTTIPSRIHAIEPIIKSLANQTLKPDAIYLHLPDVSRREQTKYPDSKQLPLFLKQYGVTVHRCRTDYGPITKLYPSLLLETDPTTRIITVDDDIQYAPTMIEGLVRYSQQEPKSALGYSGWIYGSFPRWFELVRNQTQQLVPVDFLQGVDACLYPRSAFPQDPKALIDCSGAPPDAFKIDDIWISGFLDQHHIDRKVVPLKAPGKPTGVEAINALHHDPKFLWRNFKMMRYFRNQGGFHAPNWGWWKSVGIYPSLILGLILLATMIGLTSITFKQKNKFH